VSIQDIQITLTPALSSGFLEIIGAYHPRWPTMPVQPGISCREFNFTVGAILTALREAYDNVNSLVAYYFADAWSSTTTCAVNSIVTYQSSTYISVQGVELQPESSNADDLLGITRASWRNEFSMEPVEGRVVECDDRQS
jgi:hypothetical protein